MTKKTAAHNAFFKYCMQEKRLAEGLLRAYLPAVVVEIMDFATLHLVGNERLPAVLKKLRGNAVLRCQINRGENWLYFIVERQSTPNQLMALGVREYVTLLMRYHLRQGNKKLPLIMPLVVYHGSQSPYPFTTQLWDCFNTPKLACELMLKPFQLIDLSVVPDIIIETHGPTAIMEWLLRDGSSIEEDDFFARIKQYLKHPIYRGLLENFGEFRMSIFRYILSIYQGAKSAEAGIEALIHVVPEERWTVLTVAQQLKQRGRTT